MTSVPTCVVRIPLKLSASDNTQDVDDAKMVEEAAGAMELYAEDIILYE